MVSSPELIRPDPVAAGTSTSASHTRVTVIIPARNAEKLIGRTVRAVREQEIAPRIDLEVTVVDDGSTDDTAAVARSAGARVISIATDAITGNPAAARNHGAARANGDLLVFLDADCEPADGWLEALLGPLLANETDCTGGSLGLPDGLPLSARLDYYCGWYHVHPERPAGPVPNHPPANLCVRRSAFAATSGFCERRPVAYSHEELRWQAELQSAGGRIVFEPAAIALHWNRPGFGNLLRRNYRWGYGSIEAKAQSGTVRLAALYRYPWLLVALSLPLALPLSAYVIACWLRVGVYEPLLLFPAVAAARLAYAVGMAAGGLRWLRERRTTHRSLVNGVRTPDSEERHELEAGTRWTAGVRGAPGRDRAASEPGRVLTRPPVLMVAPQPFYEDRGTPIAVRQVLAALSQLGYPVDLLTYPMGASPEIPGVRYHRLENPLRIQTVPIGFSFRKLWLDAFLFYALKRKLRKRSYLCIHAVEEAALFSVLAARRHRIPVVYDMQSSLAEAMARKPLLRNAFGRAVLSAGERWLIRNSDWIITSAGLRPVVEAAATQASVREWRYPSTARPASRTDVERLRTSLEIAPAQTVVLYTGNFEDYQGLPLLLAAVPRVLRAVPKTVFVLVGADETKKTRGLERMFARVPRGALRVLRRQTRERMPEFLAMADVVVSPRVYGANLPLKILEYLAAGCAIVATSIPAHLAVLNEECAQLTAPTPDGLADAITALLTDKSRAATLRRSALTYAEQNLDWLGFVRSVGELYDDVRSSSR